MIEAVVRIAEELHPCGVRAIAYPMFNQKLIREMSKGETQKVSKWSVIAREEGLMPWDWIVDETREEECVQTWADPAAYARTIQHAYRRNKWDVQPKHITVWSEKNTVKGTLNPVLRKYEIPYQPVHGFSGATSAWDAAQANLERYQSKQTLILYIGDFDPSGMYMSDVDLPNRLARYMTDTPSDKTLSPDRIASLLRTARVEIRRIALTRQDTIDLGEGPRWDAATKKKDPRYPWFVKTHGHSCWELDAMSPNDLRERVESAIRAEIDHELWNRYTEVEQVERDAIVDLCSKWKSISVPVSK